MNEAFSYLTEPVARYEGTIARLMGDAILAFFGAPLVHEEDPQRAVLAGLEIVKSIAPFREQIKAEYGFDFDVRVGINTGTVVVGDVGSNVAAEYTAMGDAVNVASRMEQTAEPGTVQVAESTFRLVEPLFEFESLGGIEVKGKSEPVQSYRAIAAKEAPGRVRGIEGLESPMVGRETEFEVLRQLMGEASQGRGHIVTLLGEAGLGKSRLISEAHAEWMDGASGTRRWAETRGIAYDMNRPYGLFYHLAKDLCGLSDADTPEEIHQKIVGGFASFHPDAKDQAVRAMEMLLDARALEGPELQGDAFKRELFAAMRGIWRQIAEATPTILVMDDLHWADKESVELLIDLLDLTEEVPLVFLCAFRPERQASSWRMKQQAETDYPHLYTELVLKPLTGTDTGTLVDNLLTISDLPPQVRELILKKTEGNQFFVEEVVRTLIDSGAVVRDAQGDHWRTVTEIDEIAIPDNLQALLISRIDRLDEQAKATLQVASVIGRSFYRQVLKRVSNEAIELDRHLSILQRFDLIQEAARVPDIEYMFRHELTRQAAYDSILRRRRPEFHQRVAEAIEDLFSDRQEEEAHRLAYHFSAAEDYERALKYSIIAGDAAARLYANDEAVAHYGRALELAKKADAPNEQIIYLYTKRGRTLELASRHDEALASYRELEELGHERNDKYLEIAALVPQATLFSTLSVKSNPELGKEVSLRALELARECEDPKGEAKSLWNLMLAWYF